MHMYYLNVFYINIIQVVKAYKKQLNSLAFTLGSHLRVSL